MNLAGARVACAAKPAAPSATCRCIAPLPAAAAAARRRVLKVGRDAGVFAAGERASLPTAAQRPRRSKRGVAVQAAVIAHDEDFASYGGAEAKLTRMQFLNAFWRFTRPHTIYGTLLSVISVSMLAVNGIADINTHMLVGLLQAVVPALLMNVCIVGFNQITDVEIDKVNKPYLPLASGEFTVATGWTLVLGTGIASLLLGALSGSVPLLLTLGGSAFLGFVYSADVPFMRWKRFPALAAACILVVRAVAVQFGFFLHMSSSVLGREPMLGTPVLMAAGFMCLFSLVIAFFKDIPDVEGDRRSAINTLSVRYGAQPVFDVCIGLLLTAYAGATVAGLQSQFLWTRVLLTVAHGAAAAALWRRSREVDTRSHEALTAFYMYIWKLFYLEYLAIPFFR